MSSWFEPITDPDKAWEYRQAGVLYWCVDGYDGWGVADIDPRVPKEVYDALVKSRTYQYAVLVEDDACG